MISIAPGSNGRRVLGLVVDLPGQMDAESIGRLLWPPPIPPAPALVFSASAATTAYHAWLGSIRGRVNAKEAHAAAMSARASGILGRLQEMGLIEKMRPPAFSPWWLTVPTENRGAVVARLFRVAAEEEEDPEVASGHLLALIAKVEKGPRSVNDLLGADPSGAIKGAYAQLISLGIVVPPSYRWPTQQGREVAK